LTNLPDCRLQVGNPDVGQPASLPIRSARLET